MGPKTPQGRQVLSSLVLQLWVVSLSGACLSCSNFSLSFSVILSLLPSHSSPPGSSPPPGTSPPLCCCTGQSWVLSVPLGQGRSRGGRGVIVLVFLIQEPRYLCWLLRVVTSNTLVPGNTQPGLGWGFSFSLSLAIPILHFPALTPPPCGISCLSLSLQFSNVPCWEPYCCSGCWSR